MVELTKEQFEAAKARGEETRRRGPLAESVRYDAERNRIVVRLNTGTEIAFEPTEAQGLESAAPADLANVEIEDFGLALHWPTLDADHWVPALAEKFGQATTVSPSNYAVARPKPLSRPSKGGAVMRSYSIKSKPGLLAGRIVTRDAATGRFLDAGGKPRRKNNRPQRRK
jgi:hypothetical protein